MKFIVLSTIVLFSSISCASKKKLAEAEKNAAPATQVLSLSKTACFGECPVFTLKIFSDRKAVLDGDRFLKHVGLYEMMLSKDEMKTLMTMCEEAQLMSLKDSYMERVMDLPTTTLVYSKDGQTKKIKGNMGLPQGFKDVVKSCMNLLDDERWELKKAYQTK